MRFSSPAVCETTPNQRETTATITTLRWLQDTGYLNTPIVIKTCIYAHEWLKTKIIVEMTRVLCQKTVYAILMRERFCLQKRGSSICSFFLLIPSVFPRLQTKITRINIIMISQIILESWADGIKRSIGNWGTQNVSIQSVSAATESVRLNNIGVKPRPGFGKSCSGNSSNAHPRKRSIITCERQPSSQEPYRGANQKISESSCVIRNTRQSRHLT